MSLRLSASAIKALSECPRKWAFRYLCGLPRGEPTEAMSFGTACHTIAEDWLTTGKTPDSTEYGGRLFLAGVHLLPAPRQAECELKLEWEDSHASWLSFLDFTYVDPREGTVIGDHKFQVRPTQYGLNEKTLADDPAAILYAMGMHACRDAWGGLYRWIYYDKSVKSRPDAYAVEVPWRIEDVKERYEAKIVPLVNRAKEIKAKFDLALPGEDVIGLANTIGNDPGSCGGCGRFCDFSGICNIWNEPPREPGDKVMSRLHLLNAEKTTVETPVAVAAPVETCAPQSRLEMIETTIAPPKVEIEVVAATLPEKEASFTTSLQQLRNKLTEATGVNPPEAAEALVATAAEVDGAAEQVVEKRSKAKKAAPVVAPAPVAPAPVVAPVARVDAVDMDREKAVLVMLRDVVDALIKAL